MVSVSSATLLSGAGVTLTLTAKDAAGNARMVYSSVREFAAEQAELFAGRGSFTPRHASSSAQTPTPHTVIVADVTDPQWEYVISAEGIDGVTFFDLTGGSMWSSVPERTLRFDELGVIDALPRDRDTWMVIDEKPWFFALTDHLSVVEAEEFAQNLARWRLAEAYEEIGQRVAHIGARDIMAYYGIDDPASIDFDSLCLAPPALDLATYAADVVRGRPTDAESLQDVLEPLLAGYGTRPEGLEWHLAAAILTRAAHPFHRQLPGWRERMEAMVSTAEATLA